MRLETSDVRINVQNMHQSRHAAGTEHCAGMYNWKGHTSRAKAVCRISDGQGYWRAVANNVHLECTIGKATLVGPRRSEPAANGSRSEMIRRMCWARPRRHVDYCVVPRRHLAAHLRFHALLRYRSDNGNLEGALVGLRSKSLA